LGITQNTVQLALRRLWVYLAGMLGDDRSRPRRNVD
jgi:hypothetical protein